MTALIGLIIGLGLAVAIWLIAVGCFGFGYKHGFEDGVKYTKRRCEKERYGPPREGGAT